jgi:NAD(P)-dependent dehydrogenase (short-subunit alcohol dehydrogenase family)
MELEGKVALVTGAGMGIGKAIALRLAAEGAAVAVNDIDDSSGLQTAEEIERAGGRAVFILADVANESDVEKMIALAEDAFGGLDILVNNAAPAVDPPFFPQSDVNRWRRTLDVCLVGTMFTIQHGLPAMAKRGGGAIVNVSSMAGIGFGPHDAPEYAAAKAGIVRLTGTLAPLGDRANVRINCICPNWVATEKVRALVTHLTPEMRATWHCPELDKMARPEDIAAAVAGLVRDETLAGRTMLYDGPGETLLVPADSWPV